MTYKIVKFMLLGYNELTPQFPYVGGSKLVWGGKYLEELIRKYGEPLNFYSEDDMVAGYADIIATKIGEDTFELAIDPDDENSYIIGYLKRILFKSGITTENAGIAVKVDDHPAISIYNHESNWNPLYDIKFDPPYVLRFPKQYVKYGSDGVKIIPKVINNTDVKLYNKLKEQIVEKKPILSYNFYEYSVVDADVYITVKGDNNKFYDVVVSDNKIDIIDLENEFKDVNNLYLNVVISDKR